MPEPSTNPSSEKFSFDPPTREEEDQYWKEELFKDAQEEVEFAAEMLQIAVDRLESLKKHCDDVDIIKKQKEVVDHARCDLLMKEFECQHRHRNLKQTKPVDWAEDEYFKI